MKQRMRKISILAIAFCLAAFGAISQTAFAQAEFIILNFDGPNEGLNDPEPRAPLGGNPATTLGEQRQFCIQFAADIWAECLSSPVPIQVFAQFNELLCIPNVGAILGSAGPFTVHGNFTNAPEQDTWFVQAEANALSGTDLDPSFPDMAMQFNSLIDDECIIPGLVWYYGVDGNAPPGQLDFFATVLHEIGHGIGFLSIVDETTGENFFGLNDIWNYYLEDNSEGLLWKDMTDGQRMASAIDDQDLVWAGSNVNNAAAAIPLLDGRTNGKVRMYAPNPVRPGSSVSHFDVTATPEEIMEPFANGALSLGLATDLLKDIGWPLNENKINHEYTIFADKRITLQKRAYVEGEIRANDRTEHKKGSLLLGKATASEKVRVLKGAEIDGDAVSPEVDNRGTITGTAYEVDVPEIDLPDLPNINPGSENVEVGKNESLNLAPGAYKNIDVRENGTLNLVNGEYHVERLRLHKRATVNLDATAGDVDLLIERDLDFIRDATFNAFDGPNPTKKVTIWCGESGTISVRKGVVFNGCNLVAPEARIKFQKQSFFKGLVCAEDVDVQKSAVVVSHSSLETPKTVELLVLNDEEDIILANATIPESYELEQNFPNPFNPTTTIKFGLPEASEVTLKIFNIRGQLVRTLTSGSMEAGFHQVQWDATNENGVKVGSGMYFYQIQAGEFQQVRKMLLLK